MAGKKAELLKSISSAMQATAKVMDALRNSKSGLTGQLDTFKFFVGFSDQLGLAKEFAENHLDIANTEIHVVNMTTELEGYSQFAGFHAINKDDWIEVAKQKAEKALEHWVLLGSKFTPDLFRRILDSISEVNELRELYADEVIHKEVEKHHRIYEHQAIRHGKTARCYTCISASVLGLVLLVAYFFLGDGRDTPLAKGEDNRPTSQFQKTEFDLVKLAPRVAIFAGLFYAVSATFRIARSNYHLEAVYRQRALACRSYKPILKAVDDPETKRQVVKDMTSCLFSSVPTGYIPTEKDEGAEKIVNMIVPQKS